MGDEYNSRAHPNSAVWRGLAQASITFLAASFAGCATHAPTNNTHKELSEIDAYFAADFTCTAGEATAVDIRALARNPARYVDTCIRVRGLSNGSKLAATAAGLSASSKDVGTDGGIGVYWKRDERFVHLRRAPSYVNLVGRVRSCHRRFELATSAAKLRAEHDQAAPGDVLSGPCHYDAFAVFASQADIIPTAMD